MESLNEKGVSGERARELVERYESVMNQCLVKLEGKVGPVNPGNIVEKSKGILTTEEADHISVSSLASRVLGLRSDGETPPGWHVGDGGLFERNIRDGEAILKKLSS